MPSLFTRIIKGEIPYHKVLEDEQFLAFMDIRPINPGHTLVIPKQEVDYFFDLSDLELSQIMLFARKVARAIQKTVPCQRVGIMVAGLEVPHAHVHLVPINSVGDLNFAKAKPAEPKHLAELCQKITSNL